MQGVSAGERGVAQLGSAPALGAGGRRFESARPDQMSAEIARNAGLRTPAEVVAEVEDRMRAEGRTGFANVSSAELVRADRESH
jgi:hypothetical protein